MTTGSETATTATPSNRPMLVSVARLILLTIGGLGLAYLGFWAALVIERTVPRLVVYHVAGATELDWLIGPFSVVVRAPGVGFRGATSVFSTSGLLLALPFLLQATYLLAAWRLVRSAKLPAPVAAFLSFASLWTVVLIALQAGQYVRTGGGPIGQLLLLVGNVDSQSLLLRHAVVAVLSACLLPAVAISSRRLVAGFGDGLQARGPGQQALAAATVLLPFSAILVAALVSAPRWIMPIPRSFWIAPATVLTAAFLSVLRRQGDPQGHRRVSIVSSCLAAALGLLLYVTLLNAGALRLWLDDRSLAEYNSAHYSILFDPARFDEQQIWELAAERERMLAALAARLHPVVAGQTGAGSPQQLLANLRIRLVLYPSAVAKRMATREDGTWTISGSTIRAHFETRSGQLDPAADAAALLHEICGGPGDALLGRWVARWLAGTWRGGPIEQAAARILAEEGHFALAQLMQPDTEAEISPLVREPLGAIWVGNVGEWLGPRRILTIYRTPDRPGRKPGVSRQLEASSEELERVWKQVTRDLTERFPYAGSAPRKVPAGTFFRGVNFTHEGFGGGRGGYDSAEAHETLRVLRAMGVNAIAVVPYGWMSADGPRISYTGTDETDEELSLLVHRAHTLGLKVMLKPQIWIGGGRFTGTLHFADPVQRKSWFTAYRRFLLHYARLAELEGFDLLSVGTELAGMTAYEREWRELIADVRRVFRGPLTYAANWGDEFENLPFWDVLDFLGVNNYYPLADTPTASQEVLRAGAGRVVTRIGRVARRWRKPVLFTEAGFASMRGTAVQPWREIRAAGASLAEQTAAYEASLAALDGQPWLAGVFWWKWPSHGRGAGPESISFNLPGRPAAEVISRWYRHWEKEEMQSKD